MTATLEDAALRTDTMVWPTMNALAECLCTEIAAAGLPDTCFCGVLPGLQVDTSYVTRTQGMAWVRLVSAFTSGTFPSQTQAAGNCGLPLAFELEVGAAWCAPVSSNSRGAPPTMAAQYDSTMIQVAAMSAMYRAILCCPATPSRRVSLGRYLPAGPRGGVVGGTWNLFVEAA